MGSQKSIIWPSLGDELGEYKRYLKGKVLNAGSGIPVGERDISSHISGELYNLDIFEHELIQITSPLHDIPCADEYFNAVFCNAVIEHVSNPVEVVRELYRILKPGGYLYLAVPFLQPEHLCPDDFQRYTSNGLKKLVEDAGFRLLKTGGVHNVYHTIGWVIEEWLCSSRSLRNAVLKAILFPLLRYLSRNSSEYVHSISSVYRVIAIKD